MKAHACFLVLMLLGFVNSQQRPYQFTFRQKYPNNAESDVCGRIRDVIPRNSGRFRKILIRNTNNDAQYANDDCRRMTARAKSKLDILATRVMHEWSQVRLKVLKAWTDQVDPNYKTSLHYEGRSVRLQTSDGNSGRLARLAGIALEAGFDWVEYTDRSYIRASVIPDVCQTSVDLVFLLDGSGSVGSGNFQKVKEFVKKVVDFFNIGKTGTHMAVVQYSTRTVREFDLAKYFTKSEMKSAVDRIPYQSGWTYTAEALKFLKVNIFTKQAGMRTDDGIPKVLVLLTDGKSQGDPVGPPAKVLKDNGISIFSIGVGNGVSTQQLNEIASDPDQDYVFQRTFDNLIAGWVDRLSAVSCSEGSVINSCKEAETSVDSGSFKYFRTQFQFVTGNQVSVELRDKKGVSHLYASSTSKNPGPLDPDSTGNEDDGSPKAVSVKVDSSKTVFVAVQGQRDANTFTLSFWDNLFAKSTFDVQVGENENGKLVKKLALATKNDRLKYKITDGNNEGAFRIDSHVPNIYTTKRLDREKTEKYYLVVVAENEANKCHKSRTNVMVTVGDKNDNSPRFSEDPYRANIAENARIGAVVKTVLATDADSGNNGRITYVIKSHGDRFRIDNQGKVTLTKTLDYEAVQAYTVNLEARDGGNPFKADTSELIVNVQNVNEAPSIKCNVPNCKYAVAENVQLGTQFGAKMIGEDPDIRTQCTLQYSLPSSVTKFRVASNGVITTNGDLNRESKAQYGFYVTVKDCGGLTANVYVAVKINDLNDNSPTFSAPYLVNILESEQPGSNVVQVSARDADEGKNAEISYTMSGADSLAFNIDTVNGKITTRSKLDYERKKLYQFNVQATDKGNPSKSGTTKVTVKVLDVNDNKPIFGGPHKKSVSEDAARGTHVITVQATDLDSGSRGEIRYSIVSGNIGKAFSVVNDKSGLITVNSQLDRETRSSYSLVVQASDLGSPSMNARATVTITIDDVNDNAPVFQGLPYTRSVREDIGTTELIIKVLATDRDEGTNGQVSYSIKSAGIAQETFKIDGDGNIRLKKALDYETNTEYTFTIAARDGGGKETTASVKVYVEDVNDNTPKFQGAPYTASVAENVNLGHVVKAVKATDADSGPRGRVSYSITGGNTGNAFRINAAGSVSVVSTLDREKKDSYTLTIKSQDDGTQVVKHSTAELTITITDINDNKPTFGKDYYSFDIPENNAIYALVGSLGKATDIDIGLNAQIVYSIVGGNLDSVFEFKTNGQLIAKKVLDREKTASYSLVIEARDKGSPTLYSRVPVEVTVEDKNDNAPQFTEKSYLCQIDENSASNSRVCFVRATDADIGDNGKVVYELVQASDQFSVSQDGGEIKTKLSLDRETTPSYTLSIRAKDKGNPSKESTVNVTVKVIDKNDNEPKFDKDNYSFEVKEDANVKDDVGDVTASDADEGLSGTVVYQIIGGNVNSAFSINRASGSIAVSSSLDRETLANYKLTIRASDQGNPVLASSKVVSIKIIDVNDNTPIFTLNEYFGKISEDASVSSRVVQVKATDADEGKNSEIKYTITAGVEKEHFNIDEDTGLITTAAKLDYETKKSYQLTVQATDQGTPTRSSTSIVNIEVKNTNDNAPKFVPGSPIVYVSEAVARGTKVVQFNATDEDGSTLTFSITEGNTNEDFSIDNSGLLTTKNELDRETVPFYNLTVTVTETTNNSRAAGQSTSQNLSVVVTDENDNGPVFDPAQYAKDVDENSPVGVLLTVKATDKDAGKNAEISFSIDSTSAVKFNIDSKTGDISTKAPLDYEESASHVITVTARDAGTPSLSSTASVSVTVNDLNDNRPRFSKDYTTTLLENTAKDRTVLRVEASDPDSEENGKIIYSIESGNDLGYFTLDATNQGIIKVAKSPDRETHPSFTLTVLASNIPDFVASTPTAKTKCSVSITIEDVNDNSPVITNTLTTVQVEENSPVNTQVLDVDATDKDAGVNKDLVYEIVQGNIKDAFQINSGNGVISTKGAIDRETIEQYTLKVQVSDKGSPTLFSTKDFIVNVTDVDDNAPVFNPNAYDVSVLESANLSTSVVTLQATDKDIGRNGKISFSIASGNNKDHFAIDSDSGVISTKALLDYETLKEYNFVVEGRDTKHTTQANVIIRVLDINDNAPVFNPASYRVSIAENYALDKTIVTVTATDADPYGGLTYSIDPPSNMFTVDPVSGKVSPVAELDRETIDYYRLTVRVNDGGSPALSDTAVVEINITDINDNTPKFNSSREDISVLENSLVGKVLLTVAAEDADIGVNAELRYGIKSGNEADKFKLDEVSGVLSVNANIDREKVDTFSLEIEAQDQGLSRQGVSDVLLISITVLDENDNSPLFKKSRYEQNITENLSGGVFVKEVEATDADIGDNGRVSYSIVDDVKGYFKIDNKTGIVKTTRALDREDIPSFSLTIQARDHGNPSRNSTTVLQVNVLDANDNSPRLNTVVANVTEEQPSGEFVTRIRATDPDQGRNGEIEYSLTIRGSQSLKVDPDTGVVTTRVKFDYEEQKNHTFKIIATDKGNPSLSTTADLIINVIDIDDNCPEFNPKEYNVTIEENLPYLEEIVQVYATDIDTVGKLEYGIRSGNVGGAFRIDRYNATIRAGNTVDRETATEYNLIVRAGNDYCGVNLTGVDIDESIEAQLSNSIAKVNIFLTDLNDNAPKFLKDTYEYELRDIYVESLLWLNATDPDEGINAEFEFGLAGVTRVRSKRTLIVTATDKGVPSMMSNTTLDVTGIKCEAMHFSVSPRGHVSVKTLCEFDQIVVPRSAIVGESATFNCSARGNTVPEYRWYRNSVPITDWLKKGKYKIERLTKNDDGLYSCIASSDAGNILSQETRFFVKEPAKITVHPKDIWVEVGKTANLSCRATGDKPIKYSWFKNNDRIQSSAEVTADQPDLVFPDTIPEDAQEYHCEVSNYPDANPAKSETARLEVYTPDAVVELVLTVHKPRQTPQKESCQYFNMTNIEETIAGMVDGKIAVVEFVKPSETCNLTACSSDPCLNNGRCQVNESGFLCHCHREWTGKQCQYDVDECKSETCNNNGTCVNSKGSFYCECPESTSGKLCQFKKKTCKPNPCLKGKCYPKGWKHGYDCLDDVQTVSMVFKLDDARIPFKDWMVYDVAKEIENAISDAAVIQTRNGGRRRRDTTPVDYTDCSVRVTESTARDTELDLVILLVCAQPPEKKYVCDAMLKQGKVTSCTHENGVVVEEAEPPTVAPSRITLAFVVRDSEGEDTEATKTISMLKEGNFEKELEKYSMSDVVLRASSTRKGESGERDSGLTSGAITGVVIGIVVLVIVGIVLALLIIRTRNRGGKEFSIGGRAILTRTQSTDAIIKQDRDIKMRELENAEARGVNNKTFSEIYEEHGHPHDLEDGSFMVENPQLALRKHDPEYMKELESTPWFHGSISRSKAEDMLDATGNEGTFLVRSGLDMGEFYISVRTPNAEPKFRHISVNHRDDTFVAVCGADSEAREFTTFSELVEYFRANPTHIEGVVEDVLLREHIAKV